MKKLVLTYPAVALTETNDQFAAIGVALFAKGRAKAVLGTGRTAEGAIEDAAKRAKKKLKKARGAKKRKRSERKRAEAASRAKKELLDPAGD